MKLSTKRTNISIAVVDKETGSQTYNQKGKTELRKVTSKRLTPEQIQDSNNSVSFVKEDKNVSESVTNRFTEELRFKT